MVLFVLISAHTAKCVSHSLVFKILWLCLYLEISIYLTEMRGDLFVYMNPLNLANTQ